jgi:hypothetical protein
MSGAAGRDPAGSQGTDEDVAARLRALGAVVAVVGSRLAGGDAPDLTALNRHLAPALAQLPGTDRRPALDDAYLVLVDELIDLVAQIALERDTLRAQILGAPRARRAEVSYCAIRPRS